MRLGGTAGEFAEFSNEVCLIGVPAGGCRGRAPLPRSALLEHSKRVLKTRDAREPLRRETHRFLKATFQVTARYARQRRGSVHRSDPALAPDGGDRDTDAAIDA